MGFSLEYLQSSFGPYAIISLPTSDNEQEHRQCLPSSDIKKKNGETQSYKKNNSKALGLCELLIPGMGKQVSDKFRS